MNRCIYTMDNKAQGRSLHILGGSHITKRMVRQKKVSVRMDTREAAYSRLNLTSITQSMINHDLSCSPLP